MVLYNLMVVHWSIFTLFTQLVFCASAFTTPNLNSVESICDDDGVQYVHETGIESSVVMNLYPDQNKQFCKRQFHAPESHSFYVRLQKIHTQYSGSRKISQHIGMSKKFGSKKVSNTSGSCSLSISHSLNGEVLPPWRLDPCELEVSSPGEEPMRLLQGRLNIVWNHLGNRPSYRLLITVIGNGPPCLEKGKHSCFEVDDVPLLCISNDLLCDGVRHCPSPANAFNDEDSEMCAKLKEEQLAENPVQMVFRKYIQTTFKSFFYADSTEEPLRDDTTLPEVVKQIEIIENQTKNPTKQHKSTLNGLSKYGPWGYLFLGMLLCGGALLICGLWECCCRTQKPEAPDVSDQGDQSVYQESVLNNSNLNSTSGTAQTLPPYEDLDPPPAYSVLFPNQKFPESLPSLTRISEARMQSSVNNDTVPSSSSAVHIQTQTGQ